MEFKCSICQKTFDEIFLLHVCYVCNMVICENEKHSHNCTIDKSDYDTLKDIIKQKTKIHIDSVLDSLNIDETGFPIGATFRNIDFDKVEENRKKIIKPYT